MRPITDVLRDIRKGEFVRLSTDKLAEIVQAVVETGKKGSVTLKIEITPAKDGDECEMSVRGHVSVNKPIREVRDSVFFVSPDGDLLRNDPRQTEMELHDVSKLPRGTAAAE